MLKICGQYNLRTYYFEVVECVRKLMLIGLPIALPSKSAEQRTLGLIVSFITFGLFLSLQPFRDHTDNSEWRAHLLCARPPRRDTSTPSSAPDPMLASVAA